MWGLVDPEPLDLLDQVETILLKKYSADNPFALTLAVVEGNEASRLESAARGVGALVSSIGGPPWSIYEDTVPLFVEGSVL